MLTDQSFIDSCGQFNKNFEGNYTIKQVDSTFNCDQKRNISCDEAGKLRDYSKNCMK